MSRGDGILRRLEAPSDGKRYTEITPLITSENGTSNQQCSDKSPPAIPEESTSSIGVSWGVAAFLLVNTALGAGMLNYPYAYNQIGGVLSAALIQIVLLVFISSTMFILVYCADFNQDDTYHDVLLSMCGKRAQQISALSILLTCYGINITFLVIIGDQYDRIFNSLLYEYLDEYWFLDRKFTIFITSVLFIWPMCYAQRLDFLRHASILGMFAMLYVAFLTIYEHYKLDPKTIAENLNTTIRFNNTETGEHNMFKPKAHSVLWFEPLAVIPVLCFAYQTHEVIVPVYACMKQRSIGHFMKASFFGLVILFFLYNLVGAYGYLTFGAGVDPDIMSLYDAKDPVVMVGIIAMVIKFITTYPPLMFCGRGALDGLYGEFRQLSATEFKSTEKVRRIIITTGWFFSTVALALFAPDISVTLQLLGSMASINVFVFPGMCLISLTRRMRKARLSLMIDEGNDNTSQQRAKDYYVISGSYFSAMKKNAARAEYNNSHNSYSNQHQAFTNGSTRRNFTATFASLIEFENSASTRYYGEHNSTSNMSGRIQQHQHQHKINGYGTHNRHHSRQEEFDKLLANGDSSAQDQIGPFNNNSVNASIDGADNHNISWNNRSTTGSMLERLGSSIAPSTVAQIGISKYVAFGLYMFALLLILFGAFIFVLELVNVLGLL